MGQARGLIVPLTRHSYSSNHVYTVCRDTPYRRATSATGSNDDNTSSTA